MPHTMSFASRSLIAHSVRVLCILLVLVWTANAHAQSLTDGQTPLGIAPGSPAGSYPLSGFEDVNLFNGHLSFRLPLAQAARRRTDTSEFHAERSPLADCQRAL
jgi:hypothetical protein